MPLTYQSPQLIVEGNSMSFKLHQALEIMAKSVSLPWKAANPFWLLLTQANEVPWARLWIWKPSLGMRWMCFDRVIIVYTHVLIYNQIENFMEKYHTFALVGCIVNTAHTPAWLHVSHNNVRISLFPKGTINKAEGWIPFLGSGRQINRLGKDEKLSLATWIW